MEAGIYDPLALGVTLVILVLVAAIAAYIPARRASRLHPMRALRLQQRAAPAGVNVRWESYS